MISAKRNCSGILSVVYSEGFSHNDCPVCRLILNSEFRYAENLLYEGMLDPRIRDIFIESLGLCTYHA
ncbi:MAG: hypothetical protein QW211_05680 [Desulfurococcaceae archaeon]